MITDIQPCKQCGSTSSVLTEIPDCWMDYHGIWCSRHSWSLWSSDFSSSTTIWLSSFTFKVHYIPVSLNFMFSATFDVTASTRCINHFMPKSEKIKAVFHTPLLLHMISQNLTSNWTCWPSHRLISYVILPHTHISEHFHSQHYKPFWCSLLKSSCWHHPYDIYCNTGAEDQKLHQFCFL